MPVFVQIVGAVIALLVPMTVSTAKARVEVDANLVTALDTSSSVGRFEEAVEREGLAHALVHPQFLEVVRSGPQGRVGFAVFTWSSHGHTRTVVPWTTIANAEDAKTQPAGGVPPATTGQQKRSHRLVVTRPFAAGAGQRTLATGWFS